MLREGDWEGEGAGNESQPGGRHLLSGDTNRIFCSTHKHSGSEGAARSCHPT